MIRKLRYLSDTTASFFLELKENGKHQHIERIRSCCLALQAHAENQHHVTQICEEPPVFEAKIPGLELDDEEPNRGYLVEFTVNSETVLVLKIRQYCV